VETTEPVVETFDGTIDSAVDMLLEPEETEEVESPVEDDEGQQPEASDDQDDQDESDEEQDEPEESDEDSEDDSEEDDEDAEPDEADQEQSFTVVVDGTEKVVTLDELKRGYSGQQYVQKGMQEAAALRKETEAAYTALISERQQLAQVYQAMQSGAIAPPPQPPSRELFDSDPIGYMEAKLSYDENVQKYEQHQAQVQQVFQQQSAAEQAAQQAYMQQELETLKQVVPEFADPEKAVKAKDLLLNGGQKLGYSAEEIGSVMDHRALNTLMKAIKYDEIMAGKAKADKKATGAKPRTRPLKAGTKQAPRSSNKQLRQQKAKLKQSGSVEDAIGLLFNA
jgi:hypothetical protein